MRVEYKYKYKYIYVIVYLCMCVIVRIIHHHVILTSLNHSRYKFMARCLNDS